MGAKWAAPFMEFPRECLGGHFQAQVRQIGCCVLTVKQAIPFCLGLSIIHGFNPFRLFPSLSAEFCWQRWSLQDLCREVAKQSPQGHRMPIISQELRGIHWKG